MGLLSGDAKRRWQWWDSLTLLLYAALVATGIRWHEPWADEAQAWLIARSLGFGQILAHGVRFEGSPALWHSFLHLLVCLHVSYEGMRWVAGAVAVSGIAIFLRWAPFPLLLRILLPFTFWLAYQDAVVARSYILFTPLGFAAAALLRQRACRPLLLALVLGLCANVSVHGFIAAIGLGIVAIVQWRRRMRLQQGDAATKTPARAATALAASLFAVAVYSAFPASTVTFSAGKNLIHSWHKAEGQAKGAEIKSSRQSSGDQDVRPGELRPLQPVQHHRTPLENLETKGARLLATVSFPLSTVGIFGLLIFATLCWLAITTRSMEAEGAIEPGPLGRISLLPYLLVSLVFTSMYLAPRHCGMLMMCFLISAWLAWPSVPARHSFAYKATVAVLVLMSLEQIGWTVHSLWSDVQRPSAPAAETAAYLQQYPNARVAGFYYHTIGIAPYFRNNPFFNQKPYPYWLWSRDQRTVQQAPATIASRPDILVVGGWEWSPRNGQVTFDWIPADATLNYTPNNDWYQIVPYAEAHGYRETHRFCGEQFMRFGYSERLCDVILEPDSLAVSR